MGRLSQKLSQKKQTLLKKADVLTASVNNSFDTLIEKSNTHITHHSKWQDATDFQVTENFVFLGWTERRWSIRCALLRKVGQMFYTVSEVAKDHLKVSRATVYRLLNQGHLQGVKLRGCTRITSAELVRFERMMGGC